MKEMMKHITAKYFFPKYAPNVRMWPYKLRGKDGRNKQREFSDVDRVFIVAGLRKLAADMEAEIVKEIQEVDPAFVMPQPISSVE